jgi:signal transduction histidine kinase
MLAERTRLARELHDTLLQGFTGVALKLLAVANRVTNEPETTAALRDIVSLAQKTLEEARRAVTDLRSPPESAADLLTKLRTTAEAVVRDTGLELECEMKGSARPLDTSVETAVVRVVQEAIVNSVKHARARRARVRLVYRARHMELSIADDGRGFAVGTEARDDGGHWGLVGMRERASQIRAHFVVRSRPGRGTEVLLRVPYATSGDSHPSSSP